MPFEPNDRVYGEWLSRQPCAICGYTGGCQAHHEPPKGMGCKDGRYWKRAVPLCVDRGEVIGCHTLRHLEKFSRRIKTQLRWDARETYPRRYIKELLSSDTTYVNQKSSFKGWR